MGIFEFLLILAVVAVLFGPKLFTRLDNGISGFAKNLREGIGEGYEDGASEDSKKKESSAKA